jgi:hypothetical protein
MIVLPLLGLLYRDFKSEDKTLLPNVCRRTWSTHVYAGSRELLHSADLDIALQVWDLF